MADRVMPLLSRRAGHLHSLLSVPGPGAELGCGHGVGMVAPYPAPVLPSQAPCSLPGAPALCGPGQSQYKVTIRTYAAVGHGGHSLSHWLWQPPQSRWLSPHGAITPQGVCEGHRGSMLWGPCGRSLMPLSLHSGNAAAEKRLGGPGDKAAVGRGEASAAGGTAGAGLAAGPGEPGAGPPRGPGPAPEGEGLLPLGRCCVVTSQETAMSRKPADTWGREA